MNTIAFVVALLLSMHTLILVADSLWGSRESRKLLVHLILVSLAWGWYHWLTN